MKPTDTAEDQAAPELAAPTMCLVGIGASAGGLEALGEFVRNTKTTGRISYVVAQHLSPHHRSMLVELLSRESALPVREIKRRQIPRPDVIYITPPNKHVEYLNGALTIRTPRTRSGPQPSVDLLFASLALELQEWAVGVVLSGTGSDGARGIQAIKGTGGVTFSQDDSAKYDGMPRAALSTGCVDFSLPPGEIAQKIPSIFELSERTALTLQSSDKETQHGSLAAVLRSQTGFDFADYRTSTIFRRVNRRIGLLHLDNFETYLDILQTNSDEADRLARELLIGVTSFFRDRSAFDDLDTRLTELVNTKKAGEDIRVWVPGCSSGEEPYSIAIMISEKLREAGSRARVQIFATDLDNEALARARNGNFPLAIGEFIGPKLLKRYFELRGSEYVVTRELRDLVVFSKHDVIRDPPFSRLHLISCRNLFIYFTPPLQRRVLERFHYALVANGLLFLGKSESVGEVDHLFKQIDGKSKIFRAIGSAVSPFRPSETMQVPPVQVLPHKRAQSRLVNREAGFHAAIAKTFGPPLVIVDHADRPVHISGPIEPYLKIPTGVVQFDLWNLLLAPVRGEVRALLARSRRENVVISGRPHKVEWDGDSWQYRIEIHPYTDGAAEDLNLIAFKPTRVLLPKEMDQDVDSVASERIEELENELTITREHLQTVVEEIETSNEELQSLNEELQSSNEELQSTNEELETSNEELQSTNEELTTLNEEIVVKSDELQEANSFLTNIMESIRQPVIVTGPDLSLRRFNSAAKALFDIDHACVGQPVTNLRSRFRIPDLAELIERSLKSKALKPKRIRADRQWFQISVHAYLEDDATINGAVIIFENVTKLMETNEKLRDSQKKISRFAQIQLAILNSLPAHICLLDNEGTIIEVNEEWRRFAEANGYRDRNYGIGTNYLSVCAPVHENDDVEDVMSVRSGLQELLDGKIEQIEVRYPCHSPDEQRWFKCVARAFQAERGVEGIVVMHVNITDLVQLQESIAAARMAAEEANRAKSSFLANMSHELRTPLNAILGFAEIQKRETFGPIGHEKYKEYAADIHSAASHLLDMINQVLDLSKLEAGRHELNEAPVDIVVCQAQVFKMLEQQSAKKKIKLEAEYRDHMPLLLADENLLRQIMTNLLSNALKFTPDGGRVGMIGSLGSDGWLQLEFSDSGIGIAEEKLEYILRPFNQVRSTLSTGSEESGVGLGLALTRTLVELHEGTFGIASKVGEGTQITVRFPPRRILSESTTGIALSRHGGEFWEHPIRIP